MIRVLHSISFVDDPTRILRAVRFEQRLGFAIEPRTAELIVHALPMLERITGDRLKHEIEWILDEPLPERIFCRLDSLGVLARLHPDLACDGWTHAAFAALRAAAVPPLWPSLAAGLDLELPYFALLTYRLSRDAIHALCARLNVRGRTVHTLDAVQSLRAHLPDLSQPLAPSRLDALLRAAGDEVLIVLWAAAPTAAARDHLVDYAARLRYVAPTVDGQTLRARGLPPGPAYGAILAALRTAWLDGEVATPAEEQALLDTLVARNLHQEESPS